MDNSVVDGFFLLIDSCCGRETENGCLATGKYF